MIVRYWVCTGWGDQHLGFVHRELLGIYLTNDDYFDDLEGVYSILDILEVIIIIYEVGTKNQPS